MANEGDMQAKIPKQKWKTDPLLICGGFILGYIPPAEDTLVSAGEAGGGFHAAVGLNSVESVLVAAASPSQHRLTKKQENNTFNVIHVFSLSKKSNALLGRVQYDTLVHRQSFTPEWLPISLYPAQKDKDQRVRRIRLAPSKKIFNPEPHSADT